MYIAIKSNENLEKTIKSLLEANLKINVRRHPIITFIDVDLKAYNYGAYLSLDTGKNLIIHSFKENDNTVISIDLEDICTVWDLD